jgi:hypothetical protein
MPRPKDMPKLEELISAAEADELRASVKTYVGWKKAMARSWYSAAKGSGKETEALDTAYLKLQDTTVAEMAKVGDNNTLLKLDKLIVDWLVKKQGEHKPEKLKSHARFQAILALSDHVNDLLDEMKVLNQEKLAKVNNMADMINAVKKTQAELTQAESAKTGKPAVISQFHAMHHLFAPPGFRADPAQAPAPEKTKPASAAETKADDQFDGERLSPTGKK